MGVARGRSGAPFVPLRSPSGGDPAAASRPKTAEDYWGRWLLVFRLDSCSGLPSSPSDRIRVRAGRGGSSGSRRKDLSNATNTQGSVHVLSRREESPEVIEGGASRRGSGARSEGPGPRLGPGGSGSRKFSAAVREANARGRKSWLGGRDSNPDSLVQSQLSYH